MVGQSRRRKNSRTVSKTDGPTRTVRLIPLRTNIIFNQNIEFKTFLDKKKLIFQIILKGEIRVFGGRLGFFILGVRLGLRFYCLELRFYCSGLRFQILVFRYFGAIT